jgi:hypothetical protein
MKFYECERPSAAVPRDLPLEGLSLVDLALLGEGDFTTERTMDEKWMGFIRHALGTVGMYLVMTNMTTDAMWTQVTGAVMVLVPFVWSWLAKKDA